MGKQNNLHNALSRKRMPGASFTEGNKAWLWQKELGRKFCIVSHTEGLFQLSKFLALLVSVDHKSGERSTAGYNQ